MFIDCEFTKLFVQHVVDWLNYAQNDSEFLPNTCMQQMPFATFKNAANQTLVKKVKTIIFPLNVRAVSAKIKLPNKYLQHSHILTTDEENLSILLLPGWPRERKLDLKLSTFQLKRRFMSVQNKMAPVFSIFWRDLTLIFLRMLRNFIVGSLGEVN